MEVGRKQAAELLGDFFPLHRLPQLVESGSAASLEPLGIASTCFERASNSISSGERGMSIP
jgi:hypothetical protein